MSQPPTGYNTPGREAPQGENRDNPPPLPGAMPISEADPNYPEVPTGIYTGASLPEDWPRNMNPKDARNATNMLIQEIEDRVQVLKKVVSRIA